MVPSLPLLSCESSMSVKENLDRKNKSFISNRTPSEIFHWEFFEIYLNFYRTSGLGTAVSGFLIILSIITFWRQNKFLRLLSIFSIVSQYNGLKNPKCFWNTTLYKKCPYSELFWFLFSHIRTEYGEIPSISLYSVQMRENTDQNNSEYGHFSRSTSKIILLTDNTDFLFQQNEQIYIKKTISASF